MDDRVYHAHKSESLECFKKFHMYAETIQGINYSVCCFISTTLALALKRSKVLRTDNGGEYLSND